MQPNPVYSRTQILLHWAAFLLIAQQYLFKDAISEAWNSFTKGNAIDFNPLVLAHVAGGALVLAFAIWRLVLRRRQKAESASATFQDRAAKVTHVSLYALMLLMPLSGAVAWFGGAHIGAEVHNVLKIALLALIGLHVLAAVYHQFVLRDGLMSRMKPARS